MLMKNENEKNLKSFFGGRHRKTGYLQIFYIKPNRGESGVLG